MKTYSLEELQKMARIYFDRYQVKKMFATADGQFFLLQNRADLHARNNLKVYPIENEDAPAEALKRVMDSLSVKDLTAKLQTIDNLSQVQDLLFDEVAGANRKTAVAVIEARCREIAESQDVRNKN